jgi:hypothetical protein
VTVRIPPRLNTVLDWLSVHVARPVRNHPYPVALATVSLLLPAAPAMLAAVGLAGFLAGGAATRRAARAREARLADQLDQALREAGAQRHRANTLQAQLTHDTVTTHRLPTIGGPR